MSGQALVQLLTIYIILSKLKTILDLNKHIMPFINQLSQKKLTWVEPACLIGAQGEMRNIIIYYSCY